METAGSEAVARGLESQMSYGGDVIILFLNKSTFLPISNIINVLCKNVYITEKHGEESEHPQTLSAQSRKVMGLRACAAGPCSFPGSCLGLAVQGPPSKARGAPPCLLPGSCPACGEDVSTGHCPTLACPVPPVPH